MVNGKDSKNGQKILFFEFFTWKNSWVSCHSDGVFHFLLRLIFRIFVFFIYFNSVGRGKILSYSDLISVLAIYIGVQLRGPSHRGADQLGFPLLGPTFKLFGHCLNFFQLSWEWEKQKFLKFIFFFERIFLEKLIIARGFLLKNLQKVLR